MSLGRIQSFLELEETEDGNTENVKEKGIVFLIKKVKMMALKKTSCDSNDTKEVIMIIRIMFTLQEGCLLMPNHVQLEKGFHYKKTLFFGL